MKRSISRTAVTTILQVMVALTFISTKAYATPILGEVAGNGSNYSVIHTGSNPGGSGQSSDWLWFDDNQALNLDLNNGFVSLLGTQTYNLSSQNGATSLLEITGLDLNLNDVTDGFLAGTLDYVLDGSTSGTFVFENINMGVFNSASFDGTDLEIFAWGGDEQNGLGVDFAFTGTVGVLPPNAVPVPSTLILLGLGLAGLARRSRKQKTA